MIKINLLPDEYKVEDHTSTTRILSIFASIVISLISCGYFLFVHFHELPNMKTKLNNANIKRNNLRKAEVTHAKLTKLLSSFKSRMQAIEMVKALRVPFSQKLYQFCATFQGHPVWIDDLQIKSAKAQRTNTRRRRGIRRAAAPKINKPTFEWSAKSSCASDTLQEATKFYLALTSDEEFFKDFKNSRIPQYTKKEIKEDNYRQKISWQFDLSMVMQMHTPAKKKDPKTKRRGR